MRQLMAHSVSVWESDPEAYSYHSVGYMQISPEVMHEDVASIAKSQKEIGYPSEFIEGEADSMRYMKRLFGDWQAKGITSVLHEKKGGYANNQKSMCGLAEKAKGEGVRILPGVRVTGFQVSGGAVSAVETDKGVIKTDYVVVGAGPWVKSIWEMLDLPKTVTIKGRDGKLHTDIPMWTYWCLQEGTLGVDPDLGKLDNGEMPPVIHVDTDAPLYSDIDGSLITDKIWGLYYKPDFCYGGVQGGAMPYKVPKDPDTVRVDPYGPESPEFVVGEDFERMWCSALGVLPEALRGQVPALQEGADRRHRRVLAGQLPGLRRLQSELLRRGRLESRLQDARRGQAGRGRNHGPAERDPRAVPLLALCRGQAAPGVTQPVPLELGSSLREGFSRADSAAPEGFALRSSVATVRPSRKS